MMHILRLNRPSTPAVGLSETKDHIRVTGDHDDVTIDAMIVAAAREIEDAAEIALMTQTIRVIVEGWPDTDRIRLPIGPVMTDDPVFQVVAEGEMIDAELIPGKRPSLVLGETVTEYLRHARFTIEYEAGFGSEASDLPPDIAHAIKDQVAALYDGIGSTAHGARTPQARGTAGQSYAVQRVIGRYRGVRA